MLDEMAQNVNRLPSTSFFQHFTPLLDALPTLKANDYDGAHENILKNLSQALREKIDKDPEASFKCFERIQKESNRLDVPSYASGSEGADVQHQVLLLLGAMPAGYLTDHHIRWGEEKFSQFTEKMEDDQRQEVRKSLDEAKQKKDCKIEENEKQNSAMKNELASGEVQKIFVNEKRGEEPHVWKNVSLQKGSSEVVFMETQKDTMFVQSPYGGKSPEENDTHGGCYRFRFTQLGESQKNEVKNYKRGDRLNIQVGHDGKITSLQGISRDHSPTQGRDLNSSR